MRFDKFIDSFEISKPAFMKSVNQRHKSYKSVYYFYDKY